MYFITTTLSVKDVGTTMIRHEATAAILVTMTNFHICPFLLCERMLTKVSINGILVSTVELRQWEGETKVWFHQTN